MDFRSQFPLFQTHPSLVYLDSASTTQKPRSVLEAMEQHYTHRNANVHRGLYPIAEEASTRYEAVREMVRGFLNAESTAEIVFTRGTTESLNVVAQGWGRQFLKPGDEILLSVMEHHSNVVPWQLIAERTGAVLKFVPLTQDHDFDYEAMESLCGSKTRVVCVTGLSNTLGVLVDLARVRVAARKVGALFGVDAAQLVVHRPVDVRALEVDFLAFSSHKIYGSTGLGVFYAKRALLESMDPWLGGGDMIREVHLDHSTWNDLPWKFEAGTPPIAEVIGLGAALGFIHQQGWETIQHHEVSLYKHAMDSLKSLPFVKVFGPHNLAHRSSVISFEVEVIHAHDVASFLGQEGVCVRAGHHCTMPLMKALGVVATTRASFGLYNTPQDVDRLVEGLETLWKRFS